MHDLLIQQFLKNLILGKHPFVKSTSVYKRSLLTGYLSLLLIAISFAYLIYDLNVGIYASAPYYFILIGFAIFSFFLNRMGRHALAKFSFLYTTLGMVFLFGSSEPDASGNYYNLFPLILSSFALYGYKRKVYPIIFTLVCVGVFLFMYFTDYPIIELPPLSPEEMKMNALMHFIVAMIATFCVIIFLTKLNYTIESYLKNNESYLNKILVELEAHKQRLELAFKGSNAGLYDWDIKSNTIYHSPIWKNMLGYEENELDDFSIEDFYDMTHPDDTNRIKSKINNLVDDQSRYSEEVRIRTKSGEYKWFIDSGMALWNDFGEPLRIIGSIIDITEIKEAEAKIRNQNKMLEKTNEELDRFVYSASHDLRAPLMSILGLIDIASNSNNKIEINECLSLMANRVNRLDEFIGEIIDFSRNSRTEVTNDPIYIDTMVREVIHDLQFIENFDQVQLQLEVEPNFLIYADKQRVEVILRNLISNAYKYHNPSKRYEPFIKISALRENGSVKISVEDNGDGVSTDKHQKIFEMFYRGSEKSAGSGLGLYIARETVQKLNGTITIQSDYRSGSIFSVEIPQATKKQKAPTNLVQEA